MHVRALASSRSTVRKHRSFMVPSGPATRACSAEEPGQKLPGGPSLLALAPRKQKNSVKFVLNLQVLYMPVTA